MIKIPESFGNIPTKQLKLDPQDKINKIEAIAKFFAESAEEKSDDLKTKTYFKYYNIGIWNDDLESLKESLYRHDKDTDIQNFYEYLFSNKITNYFHDKNAIEEVFKLEKYQDLKAYLDECFNCLQIWT